MAPRADAPLRLAFMGSPDFALPALRALHAAGHRIVAVYCQPPRPAGRGQATMPCPVQRAAEEMGLPVRSPARLRGNQAELDAFAALDLDVAVIAAYGLILPQAMLDAPRRGCLNIHASLLPRWRGAAPIQAAILAGDPQSGVCIMQMEAGLDTGPVLRRAAIDLPPRATASWLHDQLAEMGAALILQALDSPTEALPQPAEGASYAPRLTRADGRIDWTRPAAMIDRQIRALTPWPGSFCLLGTEALKLLAAEPESDGGQSAAPGTLLDDQLLVACGEGALRITRLQRPGRAAQQAETFLRGHPLPAGLVLE